MLCHCRVFAGHQTQVVCLTALLEFFLEQQEDENKQDLRSAAQHHFLGPHYKANQAILMSSSVYMCHLLQVCPHAKLPEGVHLLPILSFPRKMQE